MIECSWQVYYYTHKLVECILSILYMLVLRNWRNEGMPRPTTTTEGEHVFFYIGCPVKIYILRDNYWKKESLDFFWASCQKNSVQPFFYYYYFRLEMRSNNCTQCWNTAAQAIFRVFSTVYIHRLLFRTLTK